MRIVGKLAHTIIWNMSTSNSPSDKQSDLQKELLGFYEKLVISLAKNHAKGEIKNDSMDHAEILFKHMIQSATDEVIIYTGKLNPEFYLRLDVTNAFRAFIEKSSNGRIFILHEEDINEFITSERFKESPLSNNHVYLIHTNGTKINGGKHFIVTDQNSYREENHASGYNHDICMAKADFNDEKKANHLRQIAYDFIDANTPNCLN